MLKWNKPSSIPIGIITHYAGLMCFKLRRVVTISLSISPRNDT